MKEKKISFARLRELQNGVLEGGFKAISAVSAQALIGGETTNNCNGGNCVTGCGTGGSNVTLLCGGTINSTPGCGAS